jgi:putative DNA primase/helicase
MSKVSKEERIVNPKIGQVIEFRGYKFTIDHLVKDYYAVCKIEDQRILKLRAFETAPVRQLMVGGPYWLYLPCEFKEAVVEVVEKEDQKAVPPFTNEYQDDSWVWDQVSRTYRLMFPPGSVVELRCLETTKGNVVGYYNDPVALARDATKWSGSAKGVYITLQQLNPLLIHRSTNTYQTYAKKDAGTKNEDVKGYFNLLIDFDSKERPKGTSSTDDEVMKMIALAKECRDYLRGIGFADPILAMSGNGAHLVYAIRLSVTDKKLVKAVLKKLAERYNQPGVIDVDLSVADEAQITKFYGTMTRKGTACAERPHRHSQILDAPEVLEVVPRELLEVVANIPKPIPKDFAERLREELRVQPVVEGDQWFRMYSGDLRTLDIRGLFADHDLDVEDDGVCVCPWWEEHSEDTSGTKLWDADPEEGKFPGFNCMHSHCNGRGLREVLEKFGKDAVERRCGASFRQDRAQGDYTPQGGGIPAEDNEPPHGTLLAAAAPLASARHLVDMLFTADGKRTACCSGRSWWEWTGTHYADRDDEVIRTKTYDWLEAATTMIKHGRDWVKEPFNPNTKKVNDVLDAMRAVCHAPTTMPCYLGTSGFPRTENIVSLQNGLLDVQEYLRGNVEILPHTPEWFSANSLPWRFDPSATCPRLRWFLEDVTCGDTEAIETHQMWFGLHLVPEMKYQTIMMWLGSGRNGKGVLSRVLMRLLGGGNYCTPSFSSVAKGFNRHALVGKLAAILTDAHEGKEGDVIETLEFLKAVSGCDRVDIQRKFKDTLNGVRLSTRFTVLANEMPKFPDASMAIGRRIIFLPFHQSYADREDFDLDDKLANEMPGVLNWALEGLRMLRERGRFVQPKCGVSFRQDFDEASSPIARFVEECCQVGEGLTEDKNALRDVLNNWLVDNGHKQLSAPKVTTVLRSVNTRIESARVQVGEDRIQTFKGIKLNQNLKNKWANRAQFGY